MKHSRTFALFALLVIVMLGGTGCSTPAPQPQQTADARDYPGQSYYCYLHKKDLGC